MSAPPYQGLPADERGPSNGPAVVFLHGLGLDRNLWAAVTPLLDPSYLSLALDLPGHGAASTDPSASMGAFIRRVESTLDERGIRDAVIVGHHLGGMVAQGLAVKRLDLVRGLVLTATGSRLSARSVWERRIATARESGMRVLASEILPSWFTRAGLASPLGQETARRFVALDPEAWVRGAEALAGADFYTTTASLRLPALAIAGGRDQAAPADLLRETIELIPASQFHPLPRAGHLAPLEAPEEFASALNGFLASIGHDQPHDHEERPLAAADPQGWDGHAPEHDHGHHHHDCGSAGCGCKGGH